MQVLPYCILLYDPAKSIPQIGVLTSPIHRLTEDDLLIPYSELVRSDISPKTFQAAALQFHHIVNAIFEQTAIVPFRFPTWVTPSELSRHLQQESQRYTTFLSRNGAHVQMELRIAPLSRGSPMTAGSGTAHLRERAAELRKLHSTAESLKNLLSSEVIEWRQRDTPTGFRLYALVERASLVRFREKVSRREHDVSVRWSGPWPATEFL